MTAFSRDTRVLVTGGTGFVGRLMVATMRSRLDGAIISAGLEPDCDVALDLLRPETVEAAVTDTSPHVIIHLAAQSSVAAAADAAARTWRINVAGSLELAAAFARVRPNGLFFFTSSAEVYGRAYLDGPVSEATAPQPDSVYGCSKLAAELMLSNLLPAEARLLIVRPSNHIGPGQAARFVVPSLARQLAEAEWVGAPAVIRAGNLDVERDFMDVRDVVRAYAMLLGRDHAEGTRGTYNVAAGSLVSVRALLSTLQAEARVDSRVEIDPAKLRQAEVIRADIDATLFREQVGWSPEYHLASSLRDVLDEQRQFASNGSSR